MCVSPPPPENSVLLRLVGELYDERRNPLAVQLGSHFRERG